MCTRFGIAALFVAALLGPIVAQDQGQNQDQAPADQLSCERVCNFTVFVPPVLECSECRIVSGENGQVAVIDVRTNTCVSVNISSTDFERFERDCDGNLLQTKDVLENAIQIGFTETIECPDGGSPLQVQNLGNNSFRVAPHRGGFQMTLSTSPTVEADICDDAGCYTATVRVLITTEPVEDCPDAGQIISDGGHNKE